MWGKYWSNKLQQSMPRVWYSMSFCSDSLWPVKRVVGPPEIGPSQVWRVRYHDDVIKWKHFSRYWRLVWGIPRLPVNSPHIGQWRGALMFSLICARINGWANNREAGDFRRHRAHYDVIVMCRLAIEKNGKSYLQIDYNEIVQHICTLEMTMII